ncbi:MAG: serine hydrolase [Kofleriaceae bacterium]
MRSLALVITIAACGGSKPLAGLAPALARGDAPDTTSVLVRRGGATVFERYFEGATADTLHDTRSATKSLTALAVAIAIDHELLRLDDQAFALLADVTPAGANDPLKAAITIEDLLTMSSALDCNDDDPQSPGNEENMYPKPVWVRWAADIPVAAGYTRDATGRGRFSYCTAGTFLLGQIVQRVAKQPVDTFMATHLFAPLGITKWEFSRSPANEPMTGGGLRLRSRDLATLAELVLHAGKHGTRQVVSAELIARATTVQRKPFPDQHYGYLFWYRDYKTPCGTTPGWYMGGNGGNAIVILRELDAVAVVTRTHYNTRGMHQETTRLIEHQILPALACKR